MNRIAYAICMLVGVVATRTLVADDPRVINLWPDKTPGDVGITGQESSRMYESAIIAGPTKLITNVTKPTITVYQPVKQKNTGVTMLICPGGGYHNLFWELEGEEVAAWLNSIGVTGIILKYRVPRRPGDVRGEPPLGPLIDAQRAVKSGAQPVSGVGHRPHTDRHGRLFGRWPSRAGDSYQLREANV